MASKLRMSAEIAEWLGDLRESDPATAPEVGAALLAVMDAADATSLAFVTSTRELDEDPRVQLDLAYQRLLKAMQQVRRRRADAAMHRKRLERELGERAGTEADHADLERELATARKREDALTGQSQQLQILIDAFRTQKEVAKAVVTATRARQSIQEALGTAGIEQDDTGDEAEAEAAARADEELARAERLLGSAMTAVGLRPRSPAAGPSGPEVLELHADPLGTNVRILFGTEPASTEPASTEPASTEPASPEPASTEPAGPEPASTVTLLAVLEGEEAISEHRDDAVDLASELLAEIRDDGWSAAPADTAAGGPEFAESRSFLLACFPAETGAVVERAAVLARAVSLRGLRGDRDAAELARITGISEDRLGRIDRHGLRGTTVGEAAAYVRGLGGRLEVTAVIDGEPHIVAR
jgi:phage shock protein A